MPDTPSLVPSHPRMQEINEQDALTVLACDAMEKMFAIADHMDQQALYACARFANDRANMWGNYSRQEREVWRKISEFFAERRVR